MSETSGHKRRLFAGIALSEEARAACASAAATLQRTGFSARYEAPEKLHVTLAFLGYVEPERAGAIEEALRRTAARIGPFTVTLDKIGAFPHERRPRVIFVGARAQGAEFRSLAQTLRQTYSELGFTFDNDAVAHVTIARVKNSRGPLPAIEFAPVALAVESLTLFESLPDRAARTSRYEAIAAEPLASGG